MSNPKLTGISSITGKTVTIRHASESDMVFIREKLGKHGLNEDDLHHSRFVVADEEGEIIGFGRLYRTDEDRDTGCVVVMESRKRRGIGASIVRHLIEYAPVKRIFVVSGQADYVKRLGFAKAGRAQKNFPGAFGSVCTMPGKPARVVRAYEKR